MMMKNFHLIFLLVQNYLLNDNQKVKVNDLLAEWDPYTLPIIAEKDGIIKYVDLNKEFHLENQLMILQEFLAR